jgi:hypothetical protein
MGSKSSDDQLNELESLIDLDELPELVEDDSPAITIDLVDALDINEEPLMDDGTVCEQDTISLEDDFSDDRWLVEDDNADEIIDLSDMNDIVVDMDSDEDKSDVGEGVPILSDLLDEGENPALEDDDENEGPITSEPFAIEPDQWDELDDDEEFDEDIYATMTRLNLSFDAEEELQEPEEQTAPLRAGVDLSFIGPTLGVVSAALFHEGVPLGVGEGIYLSGADQMLHEVTPAGISDFLATSVAGKPGVLFVGTTRQGALRSRDRGHTIQPVNSWYTQGLETGDAMGSGACSTTFTIKGQDAPAGYRLFGWTGEGQLYCSVDDGDTWFGPLLKGRCCESLKVVKGSELAVVLASSRMKTGLLMKTWDMRHFEPLLLPLPLASQLTSTNAVFDVAPGMLVVGTALPGAPCYLSSDEGVKWTVLEGISGITALVVDQEAPDWMAAAITGRDGKAIIRVTEDRGKRWQTACEIEPPRLHEKPASVTSLVLKEDGSRSLIALTKNGAYLIVPDQKKLTH